MRDYGGFGDEIYYDLDNNGELDTFEEALMHAEQDWELMEMTGNRSLDSSTFRMPPSYTGQSQNSRNNDAAEGFRALRKLIGFISAVVFLSSVDGSSTDNLFMMLTFICILLAAI